MKQLKVLMIARPDLLSYPGGDTTQILQTASALRQLEVAVDVNPTSIVYEDYDLMHFFNIIDPEDILGHIKRTGLPFVLSTVYCLYDEYDRRYRKDILGLLARWLPRNSIEYVKTVGKYLLLGEKVSSRDFFWRGHAGSIRHILRKASFLLPNSESEYRRLKTDFGIEQEYMVVPNGVALNRFRPASNGKRDLVLCVARIEGRKNQLNLIRAVNDTPLKLYLVGRPANNQRSYYRKCREIAGPNVHFTGYVSDEELRELYQRSKVHVLPSWFETTGLSSLESARMGCNVVVTDRGDAPEYFKKDAWYCNPADPTSIQLAINKAFEAPWNPSLAQQIEERYNWQNAAQTTLSAYYKSLKKNDYDSI